MEDRIYQLRVKLLCVKPEVWRSFIVPGDITLDRLHDVIQIVMGWTDSHLHSFTIGKKRYTERPECSRDGVEEGRHRLVNLIKKNGRTFDYWYDFGDDWMHEITVENSRYQFPGEVEFPLPWCLGGENACPPEDVGGPPGYERFLTALADPGDSQHEEYKLWSGGDFHPGTFNMDEVNNTLLMYRRWSRGRHEDFFPGYPRW